MEHDTHKMDEKHEHKHEGHKTENKPWEPKGTHKPVHHTKSSGSNKFMIMAILLGLLIIVSGVQAVELSSIKTKIADGSFASGSSGSSSNSGSTLKNNLDSLPTMVGGC